VILVDASPIICGIWRYLIAVGPEEVLAIPDIPEGGTVDDLPVCQEARWLAGWWCNDGTATPSKSPSAWAREREAGWVAPVRRRIAADLCKIRHWAIIEGAYTEAPDIEATYFIDPPYQTAAGQHYPYKFRDHAGLGEWARGRRGQVIACDQEGADWMPWTGGMALRSTPGQDRNGTSAEVVYHRSIHPTLFGGGR
jgi:hypothetical protein